MTTRNTSANLNECASKVFLCQPSDVAEHEAFLLRSPQNGKMNFKYLFLCTFILYESASTGPVLREVESLLEHLEPSEDIIREKRKFDLLQHLETEGVGIKKTAEEEGAPEEDSLRPEITPVAREEKPDDGEESTRTRKQAPDNVCIKEVSWLTRLGR